jgi:hypothetical protein
MRDFAWDLLKTGLLTGVGFLLVTGLFSSARHTWNTRMRPKSSDKSVQ